MTEEEPEIQLVRGKEPLPTFSLLHQVLSAILKYLFFCKVKAVDTLSQLIVGVLGMDIRGKGKYYFHLGEQRFSFCW